jgi:hypothetical protein
MIAKWEADGVLGPNGRYYRFSPDAEVAGGVQVPCDAEKAGHHEAVRVEQEDDKSYTVVCKAMSEKHGKDVVMSSPDSVGAVQTRFREDRYADETFTFVEPTPKDAWSPAFVLWSVHTRKNPDGVLHVFAPTLFTLVNPRKV